MLKSSEERVLQVCWDIIWCYSKYYLWIYSWIYVGEYVHLNAVWRRCWLCYSGTGIKAEGRVSFTFLAVQWLGFGAIQNPSLILMFQHRSDLWACGPIHLYDVLSSLGPAYSIKIKWLKLTIQISDILEVGYRTNICDLPKIIWDKQKPQCCSRSGICIIAILG